jgi:hypothetical protein
VSVGGCGCGGGVVETSINWNRCSSLVLSPRTGPSLCKHSLIGAAIFAGSHGNAGVLVSTAGKPEKLSR